LENPLKYGAITRLWTNLYFIQYLQENISEYLKLVDLYQSMIFGSVEDGRIVSAISSLKSKLRNKLDTNIDTCLRLCVTKYDEYNFPYERELAIWRSYCERMGESNIKSFSNELDMEHNFLEDYNDNSFRQNHVQNVENEDQDKD